MKKILINVMFILTLVLILGMNGEVKEIEAVESNLFDLYCDNPRFMYTQNVIGNNQRLQCTFRILDSDLTMGEVINNDIELVEVNYTGDLVRVIDSFSTEYEREDETISTSSYNQFSLTIPANSDYGELDLSSVVGEIITIDHVYNVTTGATVPEIDSQGIRQWVFDPIEQIFYTFPFTQTAGDIIYVNFSYYANTDYIFTYDSNLSFIDKDKTYYQFRMDGQVLYSGMIVTEPLYSAVEHTANYSIGAGEHYYNSQYLDYDDMEDYTYLSDENYFLLHYEKDPNFSETLYIKFYDIGTSTIVETISTDDIFTFQGDNTVNDHRAFIPIHFNDGEIPALTEGIFGMNNDTPNNILTFDLPDGVYLITLETAGGLLLDYSDYLFIRFDKGFMPYDFNLLYTNLDLSVYQRVDFVRPNADMNVYWTTTQAKDLGVGYDYSNEINSVPDYLYLSYKALNTLEEGDNVNFIWTFEPSSLPHSLDTSVYEVTLTRGYTITTDLSTDQHFFAFLNYHGLGDSDGLMFASLVILLIINVGLAFGLRVSGYIIYVIINGMVMLLLSVLGLLSIWVSIGIGLILALAVIYNLNVTRSDEL